MKIQASPVDIKVAEEFLFEYVKSNPSSKMTHYIDFTAAKLFVSTRL